jgi:hypothetical protein
MRGRIGTRLIAGTVAALWVVFAAAGCAQTTRVYGAPETPRKDVATLRYDCGVVVNSIDQSDLGLQGTVCWGGQYVMAPTILQLAPGSHSIRVSLARDAAYPALPSKTLDIDAVAGHVYYIKANATDSAWAPTVEDITGREAPAKAE